MSPIAYNPFLTFATAFAIVWLSIWFGAAVLARLHKNDSASEADTTLVQTATLSLLALIIGFTFSMALERYNQRKIYEEAEANAIGTEYLRAELLPDASANKIKALLKLYTQQRILFYSSDEKDLEPILKKTTDLQNALWQEVAQHAKNNQTAVTALVVSGMNDVLNSQGYTQSAWWNRIPRAAWSLLAVIAICASTLIGYGSKKFNKNKIIFLALPFVLGMAFMLISDIDAPRGGIIRVLPENLISLLDSLP